jgi:hypothetical protein
MSHVSQEDIKMKRHVTKRARRIFDYPNSKAIVAMAGNAI